MLQGTLDVFSLDEVLGLLSGANKSGVLNINGDRGLGAISIADGQLVAGTASCAPEVTAIAEVVFELLRFDEGSFSFDGDADASGEPHELDAVLVAAHARLTEWRGIEAVVPSLAHELSLVDSLSTTDVTVDENEWSAIVAIGEGTSVGAVAQRLGLGEFDGSKRVKGLIERSLASLAAPGAVEATPAEPIVAEVFTTESLTTEPAAAPAVFETPEPAPMSFEQPASVDEPARADVLAGESVEDVTSHADLVPAPSTEAPIGVVEETAAAEAVPATTITPDPVDDSVPPMPDAPTFGEADVVTTEPVDEIPPMPEPPRPFGDEASLAGEFAAPITAEDVAPVEAGDAVAEPFAGLDPIGSVDMFEPPLRADERSADRFVIDETPAPVAPDPEVPSFAPPAFDENAFAVNEPDADTVPPAPEGSAFAAEGSAFAAEGNVSAADSSAFVPEASAHADPAADVDESEEAAADAPEKGGSLLMRYLKSNG